MTRVRRAHDRRSRQTPLRRWRASAAGSASPSPFAAECRMRLYEEIPSLHRRHLFTIMNMSESRAGCRTHFERRRHNPSSPMYTEARGTPRSTERRRIDHRRKRTAPTTFPSPLLPGSSGLLAGFHHYFPGVVATDDVRSCGNRRWSAAETGQIGHRRREAGAGSITCWDGPSHASAADFSSILDETGSRSGRKRLQFVTARLQWPLRAVRAHTNGQPPQDRRQRGR